MATNPKAPAVKVRAGPLANKTAPSSAGTGQLMTAEDRKLIAFVRTHAPQIVASLTRTASEEGSSRQYHGMNEYLNIATQLSTLCGAAENWTPTQAGLLPDKANARREAAAPIGG